MRVMRLDPGDTVFLFDGRGAEVAARLDALSSAGAELTVTAAVQADADPTLSVVLVQAVPVKLPRMDTIVQQCTELGVARIVPVLSDRGQAPRGGAASLTRKVERWRRIAESAAQQCGRATVPGIDEVAGWPELRWESLPTPRLALDPGGRALADVVAERAVPDAVSLLVGPEGGWSDSEIVSLRQAGADGVRCGPRVLRADTAGAVALSLVQYEWGDLR
jgi:16S rRNA (uracil1498-N3)-methyltransferase